MRENDCLSHPSASLNRTGDCPIYFVYIRPKDENDKRRWIGNMDKLEDDIPSHNHPQPIESKLNSMLVADVAHALQTNPSYTANELSKGRGLRYNPAAVSIAAANPATFSNVVNRIKRRVTSGKNAQYIIENFDSVVKNAIDERDNERIEDDEMKNALMDFCRSYIRLVRLSDNILKSALPI